MKRTRAAVVLAVAMLGLTGCALPIPGVPEEPEFTDETVLRLPAGTDDPRDAIAAIERRLDAVDADFEISDGDGELTVAYTPGEVPIDDSLFTTPGFTTIRPVVGVAESADCVDADVEEPCSVTDDQGTPLELGPAGVVSSDIAGAAYAMAESSAQWQVNLDFTDDGVMAMETLTGDLACSEAGQKQLAILSDGAFVSAPALMLECGDAIGAQGLAISGDFTREEAAALAVPLAAALPPGFEIVSTSP